MAEFSEPQVTTMIVFGRVYKLEVTRFTTAYAEGAPQTVEYVRVFIGPNLVTQYAEVIR